MTRRFTILSNEDLEDWLEKMNDQANGGEGFENYVIVRADGRS